MRTCEVRLGQSEARRHFHEGCSDQLRGLLSKLETDGWRILGLGKRDMITLVSLVDLTNPELVRIFFYFAPNDNEGIMGKKRLYAKIFRSREGRAPTLPRDADFFLRCNNTQRSYEEIANMAYGLIWYTHYHTVTTGVSLFEEMKNSFEQKRNTGWSGPYNIVSQLARAAIDEGINMFDASATITDSMRGGVLYIDGNNVDLVEYSLIPKFIESVDLERMISSPEEELLRGAWTLKSVIIHNPELPASHRALSGLKTTKILYSIDDE